MEWRDQASIQKQNALPVEIFLRFRLVVPVVRTTCSIIRTREPQILHGEMPPIVLGPNSITPSVGPGLLGVLFAPSAVAVTTQTRPAEAQNPSTVSSYAVCRNKTLNAISLNVPTDASATCWRAATPDGRFVYTSNPRSTSISGFAISFQGALIPIAGTVVGSPPAGSGNPDTAVSSEGRFLYTLNSGTGTVGIFGINQDGTLTRLGEAGGLTANAGYNGIAAN